MNKNRQNIIFLTVRIMLVFFLCRIHEYTRYKFCRTIQDLFYWPNGICLDTFVVIAAIIISLTVAYDELKIIMYFIDEMKLKNENSDAQRQI